MEDDSLAYSFSSLITRTTTMTHPPLRNNPNHAASSSSSTLLMTTTTTTSQSASPPIHHHYREKRRNNPPQQHSVHAHEMERTYPADEEERMLLSITPPPADTDVNHTMMMNRNEDDDEKNEEEELSNIPMITSSSSSSSSSALALLSTTITSTSSLNRGPSQLATPGPTMDPSVNQSRTKIMMMIHGNTTMDNRTTPIYEEEEEEQQVAVNDDHNDNGCWMEGSSHIQNCNDQRPHPNDEAAEISSIALASTLSLQPDVVMAAAAANHHDSSLSSSSSLLAAVPQRQKNHGNHHNLYRHTQNQQQQQQQHHYYSKKKMKNRIAHTSTAAATDPGTTHPSERNNHTKMNYRNQQQQQQQQQSNFNRQQQQQQQQGQNTRIDKDHNMVLKYHHYDWSYGQEDDDYADQDETRNEKEQTTLIDSELMEQPEESFQEMKHREYSDDRRIQQQQSYPPPPPERTLPSADTQTIEKSSSRWVTPPKNRTSLHYSHPPGTSTKLKSPTSSHVNNNMYRSSYQQALPPPTSPSSSTGRLSPGKIEKKSGKTPPPSSSSLGAANRMVIEKDCLVIVGRGKDQKSFYHSRFILSYASAILAHHLERANYVLRIPHKQSSDWEHLKIFLEPHAVQRATVNSSNMPVLLPWFRDLQLTVLLQDCDKLLLEGILFPSSSSSGNTKIAACQENPQKWTRIRNWQQDVYNIVLSTKIAQMSRLSISCRTGFLAAAEWMQYRPELFVLSGHSTTTCLLLRSIMKLLLKCIRPSPSTASTSREEEEDNDDEEKDDEDPRCEFEPPQASNLFASLLLYLPPDCVTDFLSAGTFPQVKFMLENPLLPFLLREGIMQKYEEEGLEQSLNDFEKTTAATTATETMPSSPCSGTPRRGDNHLDGNDVHNNSYSEEEFDDDHILGGLSDWASIQHVAGEMQAGFHKLLSQWSSSSSGAGCPIQKKTSRDSHRSNSAIGEEGEGSSSMNRQQRMEWLEEIWRNLCTTPIFESNLSVASEAPRQFKTVQPIPASEKSKALVVSNHALSPRILDSSSLNISKRTFVC
jgi:hypothetical protein